MSLIANEITTSDIFAPNVVIKVIARNGRKNITKIFGLIPYFSEEVQKKISRELGRRCAAGASVVDTDKNKKDTLLKPNETEEKIIQIQGDSADVIAEYLFKLGVPKEKIKIRGI